MEGYDMAEIERHHAEGIRPTAPRRIGTGVRTGGDDRDDAGTVQVTWGALIDELELAGMTVGEAQELLQAAYNIAPGVQVNVNGTEAGLDTVLAAGDALEFVRAAGEKGTG
jgi:molybdopterin converting factor small subunit